jgi:hypothetical protein
MELGSEIKVYFAIPKFGRRALDCTLCNKQIQIVTPGNIYKNKLKK